MQCPKCESVMEHKINPFSDYEQCSNCKGLWLDAYDNKELKAVAEAIDDGDEEIGKKYNLIEDIQCPQCANNTMLRMVDPQQPHIWFEQCPTCYGRFYDAGEFKDLSDLNIGDFFKRFKTKERI